MVPLRRGCMYTVLGLHMTRRIAASGFMILGLAVLGVALGGCRQATIGDTNGTPDSGASDAATTPDASLPDAYQPPDAADPPDAYVQPCVEGDDQVVDPQTGHCYVIYRTAVATWTDAQAGCYAIGGHLVTSNSQAENNLFSALAGLDDVWAGGNDLTLEGSWVWVTGEPMPYSNWRDGEPNNSNGLEHCMVVEGDNGGLWDDRPCDRQYGYICERE